MSLWNDVADPVFDIVGLSGFKSRANVFFYLPKLLYAYYSLLLFFHFSFFVSIGWYCGAGVFGLISLSLNNIELHNYIVLNNIVIH